MTMSGMYMQNPDGTYMLLTTGDEPRQPIISNDDDVNISNDDDVNKTDAQMHTPLHHAAKRGDADGTRELLTMNANVNVADARGITPLHVAACQNRISIVSMLCAAGADVDARHYSGAECVVDKPLVLRKSALHFAAERGHMEVIEVLLGYGADPKVRCDDGRSPDLAAYYKWRHCKRMALATVSGPSHAAVGYGLRD